MFSHSLNWLTTLLRPTVKCDQQHHCLRGKRYSLVLIHYLLFLFFIWADKCFLLRSLADKQTQGERHLLSQSNLWGKSSWLTNTAVPTYRISPVDHEVSHQNNGQSPTNGASGRFQNCTGGRSALLGLLLPHIIPLIIIATRHVPNQDQVLVTKKEKQQQSWVPFSNVDFLFVTKDTSLCNHLSQLVVI